MKQVDIEVMAQNMAIWTDPYTYSQIARNIAGQLISGGEAQLLQHLKDNPAWWEVAVEVGDGGSASLSDVLCKLIFEIARYDMYL